MTYQEIILVIIMIFSIIGTLYNLSFRRKIIVYEKRTAHFIWAPILTLIIFTLIIFRFSHSNWNFLIILSIAILYFSGLFTGGLTSSSFIFFNGGLSIVNNRKFSNFQRIVLTNIPEKKAIKLLGKTHFSFFEQLFHESDEPQIIELLEDAGIQIDRSPLNLNQ